MSDIRGHLIVAACCAALLIGQSSPAAAQSAEECTSTSVESILKTFTGGTKLYFQCETSWLNGEDPANCSTGWPTQSIDTRLTEAIGDACPARADRLCASTASDQYFGLTRAAMSNGESPEPEAIRRECRETIALATDKLARKSAKLMRKCNGRALSGDPSYGPSGTACTDTAGTVPLKIARAEQKLRDTIFRSCGGPDREVGGGDDLDPQDHLGFEETCRGEPDCVVPTPALPELAECMVCTVAKEVGEATTGALALPLSAVDACRIRIDHEYSRLARTIPGRLWRCHENVLSDPDAPACPSEREIIDIEEAKVEAEAEVAEECGSLDPQDDVGFPASCPDVGACGAIDVSAMAGQIDCLTCVTEARLNELFAHALPVAAYEPDDEKRRCRAEIAETIGDDFTERRLAALASCHRRLNCGISPDACPDALAIERIEGTREDAQASILSRCPVFGSVPTDPQDLGFAPTCPDVLGCGAHDTDTMTGLTSCLLCLADATVDELRSTYAP